MWSGNSGSFRRCSASPPKSTLNTAGPSRPGPICNRSILLGEHVGSDSLIGPLPQEVACHGNCDEGGASCWGRFFCKEAARGGDGYTDKCGNPTGRAHTCTDSAPMIRRAPNVKRFQSGKDTARTLQNQRSPADTKNVDARPPVRRGCRNFRLSVHHESCRSRGRQSYPLCPNSGDSAGW
jgi:hypothetical protein